MTWIKLRVNLFEDPAVILIASATDLDTFAVVGRLHRIWSWADCHTTDGKARGVTGAWLDALVSTPGFTEAMCKAGWLSETQNGIRFPKFDRHNGQSAKTRALTAQRVARSRSRSGNDGSVTAALPEERREDKRRKEKSSIARTSSAQLESSEARTGGSGRDGTAAVRAPDKNAVANGACHAAQSAERVKNTLRAAQKIQGLGVSGRRLPEVQAAVTMIARHKDPLPVVTGIIRRSRKGHVNPLKRAAYFAEAIISEARECEEAAAGDGTEESKR